MNAIKLFITTFAILTLVSCSSTEKDFKEKKNKKLTVSMKAPWRTIPSDQSDYAFINQDTKSIVFVNSLCKKYLSTSLKNLTFNILGGIEDIKITKSEKKTIKGRDLLNTSAMGKVDGVKVYLEINSIKHNRCLYDFILVSPKKSNINKDKKYIDMLIKDTSL